MKVLYVSKALVVAAYRAKLRALAEHVDVTAVIPDRWAPHGVEPEDGFDGVPIRRCAVHLPGHNHLHVYRNPGAILERERPDLVHIDEEPFSAATYQWARLCRRRGVPYLFFTWQNLEKWLPPPFGAMRARVFAAAAGGLAGTPTAAAVLRRAGYRGALAVIAQFGVDAGRFTPDPAARARVRARIGAAADAFVIGFAGRLVPEKGVHLLLEAVARVPDATLLILGDGPERRRLAAAAAAAGIEGRVRFQGHVPSTAMPSWLPACDALALPSLSRSNWVEQFGRVLIEAMACAVPVVGSSSGEIPRVIGDGGVAVPEGDAAALAAALHDLVRAPALRAELGRRGRARVLDRYTHERIAWASTGFYHRISAVEPVP